MYAVPGNTAVVFCNTVHWYVNPVPPPLSTTTTGLKLRGEHPSGAVKEASGGVETTTVVWAVAFPHELETVS